MIVRTAWDFNGTATFVDTTVPRPRHELRLLAHHTYTKPGVYLASLRATSQRDGNPNIDFTQVRNLDTVRIVVH